MAAQRIIVTGLVQGVFYRSWTQKKAKELGLSGWVGNTDDGRVEIHVEGREEKLKALEKWCWQGPPGAKVTSVAVTEDSEKRLTSFEILR